MPQDYDYKVLRDLNMYRLEVISFLLKIDEQM